MLHKVLQSLEAAALLLLLHQLESLGLDLELYGSSDCIGTYGLDTFGAVNVYFYAKNADKCQVEITHDSEYSRMCIKPVKLDGCSVTVDIHDDSVLEGFEEEHYGCYSRTGVERCTYVSRMIAVFNVGQGALEDNINFTLNFYPKDKIGYKTPSGTVQPRGRAWVAIVSVVCVLIFGIILSVVIVCCCRKRASSNTPVYGNQQVQYTSVTPQAAGYQPQPQQGNPPSEGQEFRYPTAYVYQPSGQGSQPQFQGYSVPRDEQGDQTAETHITPSAPPPTEFSDPPPPYPGK